MRRVVPTSPRELPVTQGMLASVRSELIERMNAVEANLRGEIEQLRGELRGEIEQLRGELRGEIEQLRGDVHMIAAQVARVTTLVEEQNARNAVVLEAIRAMIDRQDRLEGRVDGFENDFRSLAASLRR